jgi:AcrR family transcriptional regulator
MTICSGKRQLNKQANQAAILNAAHDAFVDLGYDAITIRDIIRKSGLAAGTFYNYFPDKESVFRALVESSLCTVHERIHAARQSAQSVEDFFYQAYLGIFEEVRNDPSFFALMFRNESVIRVFYQDNIFGLIMHSLNDDIDAAIGRGILPELDVDALTAVAYGAGYEMARLLAEQPQREPAALAGFVTRLFLGGISNLQPPPQIIRIGPRTLEGTAR